MARVTKFDRPLNGPVAKSMLDLSSGAALESGPELERLRLALAGAGALVYDWSLEDDVISWSGNAGDILGTDFDSGLTDGLAFCARLDPNSAAERNQLAHEVTRDNPAFHLQYRLKTNSGGIAWFEDCGQGIFNETGTLERIVGLLRAIPERRFRDAELAFLASRDELTGHLTRPRLREALERTIAASAKQQCESAYLLAAIDNLGGINETYGFDIADEAIAEVGQRLARLIVECELSGFIGRMGGNKFGLVIPYCSEDQADDLAGMILSAMHEEPVTTSADSFRVTLSIGSICLPEGARSADAAMARAEEALGRTKSRGRSGHARHCPADSHDEDRQRTTSIASEAISALNEKRIALAFQPIVSGRDRSTVSWECLARIFREDGSLLSAGDFVPIFEKLGLIYQLDLMVIERALSLLNQNPRLHLACNISGLTATDTSWLVAFARLLNQDRSVLERLTIEITETAAIRDLDVSIKFVAGLRKAGCRVSIDDFGSGYTSFHMLKQIDADEVKIDGSYIKDLIAKESNQIFVSALIDMASKLGLKTVAEWVGTEEEFNLLRDMGVDYMQGFYIGKPCMTPYETSLAVGQN